MQLMLPLCSLLLLLLAAMLTVATSSPRRLRRSLLACPPASRAGRPPGASPSRSRTISTFSTTTSLGYNTVFDPELELTGQLLGRCTTELTPMWLMLLVLARYLTLSLIHI